MDKMSVAVDLTKIVAAGEKIAALKAEVERLQTERGTAWAEVSRIRETLRAIVPWVKCDNVDLPGIVGAEVERLREACDMALDVLSALAYYEDILDTLNADKCKQFNAAKSALSAALEPAPRAENEEP